MGATARPRIVILGAGFGGIYTARTLARLLSKRGDAEITLIDQNNYFLFTPMLTEAASGEVDVRHIANPVRTLSRRVRFIQARVERIDVEAKSVAICYEYPDGDAERDSVQADHLVLALGSVSNYHHIEGLRERALAMKTLDDAIEVRNRALGALERADAERDPDRRRAYLTFVVGGGGFSGVETIAALNDFVRQSARFYPRVSASEIRMLLVTPGDRLLPELSVRLARYTLDKLRERGVEVLLKAEIAHAAQDTVGLSDGTRIPARTLIWTAGVTPSPAVAALDLPKSRAGAVTVEPTCAVSDHPGLWALGDCAAVPAPKDAHGDPGSTYGPTAQNATRQGMLVGRNIVASLRGEPLRPFIYTPIGELAIVGRRVGVASVYGMQFSGTLAWAMWRGVYWAKLPSVSKRVRVGIDWALDVAFGRDISEVSATRPLTRDAG